MGNASVSRETYQMKGWPGIDFAYPIPKGWTEAVAACFNAAGYAAAENLVQSLAFVQGMEWAFPHVRKDEDR